jgi:hypothetical protein
VTSTLSRWSWSAWESGLCPPVRAGPVLCWSRSAHPNPLCDKALPRLIVRQPTLPVWERGLCPSVCAGLENSEKARFARLSLVCAGLDEENARSARLGKGLCPWVCAGIDEENARSARLGKRAPPRGLCWSWSSAHLGKRALPLGLHTPVLFASLFFRAVSP